MPLYLPDSFLRPTEQVDSVYCDGGCILKNPSVYGGTYAFCYLDADGNILAQHGGYFTVPELPVGFTDVENNFCETLAILLALEGLPHGWTGSVWTDSKNALNRAKTPQAEKFGRCPTWAKQRMLAARRVRPGVAFGLCAGHPTRKELAAGHSGGLPVSLHNVWCDARCKQAAQDFLSTRQVHLPASQ